LGGGQLGRMLCAAATQLGYHCHIYAPDQENVAAELASAVTQAAYDDSAALADFFKTCDVVTYEFENVPVAPLTPLQDKRPIYPPIAALNIAQDRIEEKGFAIQNGGTTAPFSAVREHADLNKALRETGYPAILKTVRMGYDGKGQARIYSADDLIQSWDRVGQQYSVAEGFVEFDHEFSVILVRGQDGEVRFWDTPKNIHKDGILSLSSVPAPGIILEQQPAARALAQKLAEAMDYVGVLTCEFFASDQGPVFNEMAPRVHNSGHWTIEGAVTSQFENHIRAICGLPLGDTSLTANRVEMHNLIGEQADEYLHTLTDDRNHLHLYGKSENRPGRKMGHITKLFF